MGHSQAYADPCELDILEVKEALLKKLGALCDILAMGHRLYCVDPEPFLKRLADNEILKDLFLKAYRKRIKITICSDFNIFTPKKEIWIKHYAKMDEIIQHLSGYLNNWPAENE